MTATARRGSSMPVDRPARIAFVVERGNYYRTFATVVDAALKRGWQVDCWHDWGGPAAAATPTLRARLGQWRAERDRGRERWQEGGLRDEFPDSAPLFRHGAPRVEIYRGREDLLRRLDEAPPDAVFAPWPPPAERQSRAPWVTFQHMSNLLAGWWGAAGLARFDRVMFSSAHWRDWSLEFLRRSGGFDGPNAELADRIRSRSAAIGVPELDQADVIDPAAVRARLGLPLDQPVVLYLPYPVRSNPQTVWLRHVYGPETRGRALGSLLSPRHARHLARDWTALPRAAGRLVRGENESRLVAALRAFCDANGALLVVKSRRKEGEVSAFTRRRARLVRYDVSHYPPTILELLAISSLCVHFYSSAVYESVFMNVPSLCLAPPAADMGLAPIWTDLLFNADRGGVFNVPGASHALPLSRAFDALPRRRLADFPIDREARARFVERFVGFDDTHASDRFLDAVESLGGRA